VLDLPRADLTEHAARLGEVGMFIGTRDRHMLLVGGVSVRAIPVEGASTSSSRPFRRHSSPTSTEAARQPRPLNFLWRACVVYSAGRQDIIHASRARTY
jgi:hypothetical protein